MAADEYAREFEVIWADLDPNAHMRHTAFMDYGAQLRLAFLAERGMTMDELNRLGVGPILFREETDYLGEVRAGDRIRVTVELTGISDNRKHWGIRHRIFRGDGEPAAVINCRGAWMDLSKRRVCPAPDALYEALDAMPRSDDFRIIESRSTNA